jgi:type I restriction enzyme, S subunit
MRRNNLKLGEIITHRKGFITIDDEMDYKLCRVQLHRRGVLLREIIKGRLIKTKKQQICKSGDFIVAEMDAKVGGYGLIPHELEGAIVSSHYYLFELNSERINPKYLEVISQLHILQDQIKATGSTNYAAIRPQNVLDWEIPLPDIQMQEKIANLYVKTSNGCEFLNTEYSHQLDLLEKFRKQILQDAMQGKLVPQDPNDEPASKLLEKMKEEKEQLIREKKIKKEKQLPEIKPEDVLFYIPENWVWCRLGEIGQVSRGISPKYSEVGTNKILNQKCIRWYWINEADSKVVDASWFSSLEEDRFAIYKDILVNSTGEGTIGRSALVEKLDFKLPFDSHILKVRSSINQKYVCYFINSTFGQAQVQSAKGATSTKQTELGVNNLNAFNLPLPPMSEQTRIVNKIEQLMKICDELEQTIQQNQKHAQDLLQVVLKEILDNHN